MMQYNHICLNWLILRAEMIWWLHKSVNQRLLNSSQGINVTFQAMFPDFAIAK